MRLCLGCISGTGDIFLAPSCATNEPSLFVSTAHPAFKLPVIVSRSTASLCLYSLSFLASFVSNSLGIPGPRVWRHDRLTGSRGLLLSSCCGGTEQRGPAAAHVYHHHRLQLSWEAIRSSKTSCKLFGRDIYIIPTWKPTWSASVGSAK